MIVDTFTAGPRCDGWAGGQLWQLYTLQERGEDWFASESDGVYTLADGSTAERRMLVKFMTSPGVTIDGERVQPTTMHAPKADGSRHRRILHDLLQTSSVGRPSDGLSPGCAAPESRRQRRPTGRLPRAGIPHQPRGTRDDQRRRQSTRQSVKISGDVAAVERADAARTAEAQTRPEVTCCAGFVSRLGSAASKEKPGDCACSTEGNPTESCAGTLVLASQFQDSWRVPQIRPRFRA